MIVSITSVNKLYLNIFIKFILVFNTVRYLAAEKTDLFCQKNRPSRVILLSFIFHLGNTTKKVPM